MTRIVQRLHLWTALAGGLLVVLLGLSGSALVFRADFERWAVADWSTVTPPAGVVRRDLDACVARALREFPSRELARLVVPASLSSAVEVVLQRPRPRNLAAADLVSVFVDPYTLQVLGTRRKAATLMGKLQDFHFALFAGEPGLKVNGVAALGLLALTLTGPLLWWPRGGHWAPAFKVRAAPPAATWRDLHGVLGVLLTPALLLITLTALYFAFRGTANAVLALASGSGAVAPPVVARPADGATRLASLEAMVASARRAEPSAQLDELRPARSLERPASLSFRLPGDTVVGRHRMYFDPASAAVLRIDRHASLEPGGRLLANMAPWHFGSFGGRGTQWLWFVAGLAPALLFGSGTWLWWRRRRRRLERGPQGAPRPESA